MTVTVIRKNFNGTTTSAPTLSGTAGALISVLDFCLVTTMGWTKDYSGTNTASYRQPVGTSNRMYLGVDDTGTTAARVRGFEAMTAAGVAVASGTAPFPTDAQLSGGCYFSKSSTADSTSRDWLFVSDGRCFYLFAMHSGVTTSGSAFSFGDFKSFKGSDAYNVALAADTGAGSLHYTAATYDLTAYTRLYVARAHTQTGGSLGVSRVGDTSRTGSYQVLGSGGMTYPCPIEGGLSMSKVRILEGTGTTGMRGEFPGLYYPNHARPCTTKDTFDGVGTLAGKTFEVFSEGSGGQLFIETSDWGSY